MEAVKAGGVAVIGFLQHSPLSYYAFPLHRTLYYTTPAFVLTVLGPAVMALQWGGGVLPLQLAWTALVSLRFNTIRQWVLGEDRPYWWVKETSQYTHQRAPDITQYPVTCLSSPAAPTDSLLAAGVGLVLTTALAVAVKSVEWRDPRRRRLAVPAVWLCYVLFTLVVALADVFFATHFPHQVAMSMIIGVAAAVGIMRLELGKKTSLKKTLAVNALLLGISLGALYWGEAVGSFTVYQQKMFRWCQKREWMQMDPTPQLEVFVYTGYALGTALATTTRYYRRLNRTKFTVKMTVAVLFLNLVATQFIVLVFDALPRPLKSPYVYAWYSSQLVKTAFIPFCCAAAMPYFVQVISGVTAAPKQKKL